MTINEALAYIHAVDWRRSVPGLTRIGGPKSLDLCRRY